MTLDEAVAEMAEIRTSHSVLHDVIEVSGLAHALHEMYLLRNQTQGIDPALVPQRQAIIDMVIKMLKNKLKRTVREQLLPALEQWEKL